LAPEQPLRGRRIVVQDVSDIARFPPRVADGVARVAHLKLGEFLPMAVDDFGEAAQRPGPVSGSYSSPGSEGGSGVADCCVHFFERGLWDIRHGQLCGRVDDGRHGRPGPGIAGTGPAARVTR